jgi:hypothetical protein
MDMAAEPEKKIEKLLHDYSRKRREDAGAPLEMHPATRRMLQGEVGRHFKDAGTSARPWWKTLLLFGPKYAGALGMFAVLALGVWVITQQDRSGTRVGDVATRRPAAPDANATRPLGEAAKRAAENVSEVDDLRVVQEAEKSLANKKGRASTSEERLEDQVKLQVRDAENRPAPTAAAAPPELKTIEQLGREKQMVVLQDQAQAGERIAAVVTGGVLSADKSTAVAGDALAKDADRFYKLNEGKADALAVAAASAQPITARLDLAASKPADSSVTYSVITPATTNVTLGRDTKTFYAGTKFAAATNTAGELLGWADGIVPANEWAGVAIEPAKNEVARTRGVQPLGGVAQQTEWYESGTPALLRKFSVEQSDGRIRIRDAEDGSVYDGEVVAASESNVDAKAKEVHDEVRQLRRNAADGEAPVSFRARGINQRSQQMVIINGVLTDEQERVAGVAGKAITETGDSRATAIPAPGMPAEVPLRRSEQVTSDRAARVQTLTGQTAQAPSQSAAAAPGFVRSNPVFRATTLRARVQIGATNELNFRAIRTR